MSKPIPLQNSSTAAYLEIQGTKVDFQEGEGPGGRPLATVSPGAAIEIDDHEINWEEGQVFYKNLDAGANAFTFGNLVSGKAISVRLTGNPGNSTVTWPAGTEWSGGAAPTQTPTGTDVYTFLYDGITVYGAVIQDYSS